MKKKKERWWNEASYNITGRSKFTADSCNLLCFECLPGIVRLVENVAALSRLLETVLWVWWKTMFSLFERHVSADLIFLLTSNGRVQKKIKEDDSSKTLSELPLVIPFHCGMRRLSQPSTKVFGSKLAGTSDVKQSNHEYKTNKKRSRIGPKA